MSEGLGVDLVSIERIKKALKNQNFKSKVFTPQEISYCQKRKNPEIFFSARFAAKEAVKKCLANKIKKKVGWKDIEVLNNPDGSPKINLSLALKKNLKNNNIFITLSHTQEYAIAIAGLTKK